MARKNDDMACLMKSLGAIKVRHIIAIIAVIILLFAVNMVSGLMRLRGVERTNYEEVAENYIMNNTAIGQKLGNVISFTHYGVGGSSGKESYNVYKVNGENKSGVCHITLNKDSEELWTVKDATLLVDGSEYSLPVQRSGVLERFNFFK